MANLTNLADEVREVKRALELYRTGRISRRTFMSIAAATSAAAILAACGGTVATSTPPPAGASQGTGGSTPEPSSGGGGTGRKTIPFYTTENDPASLAFFASAISGFIADHPDVDIPITLYQDENRYQYLSTAFQTGTDLGIFSPDTSLIRDWAAAGYLLPITGMIQSIGVDELVDGSRVVYNGDDYVMPFQCNASALWYRKDLFQQNGLDAPTTYDKYLAAAQALNGKNGIIGVATAVGSTPQLPLQFFTPYVHQSGWDYFSSDGTLTFDQPDVFEGVKRFLAILQTASQNFWNGTFQDILTAYIGGRAAMGTFPGRLGVNTANQAPDIADVTDVVAVPAGPFMEGKLLFGAPSGYCIYKNTANPELATEFLKWITTGDNGLAFALTVPGHLVPPVKSNQVKMSDPNNPLVKENPYMQKHGDWVAKLVAMVPGAMNPSLSMGSVNNHQYTKTLSNVVPWGSSIWGSPPLDGTLFQQILLNNQDPQAAWQDAAKAMGDAATQWKSEHPDWKPSV